MRMAEANWLIVRAFGQLLDDLRSEASRIARGGHFDWWVERADKGLCFYAEDEEEKNRSCPYAKTWAYTTIHVRWIDIVNGG